MVARMRVAENRATQTQSSRHDNRRAATTTAATTTRAFVHPTNWKLYQMENVSLIISAQAGWLCFRRQLGAIFVGRQTHGP